MQFKVCAATEESSSGKSQEKEQLKLLKEEQLKYIQFLHIYYKCDAVVNTP